MSPVPFTTAFGARDELPDHDDMQQLGPCRIGSWCRGRMEPTAPSPICALRKPVHSRFAALARGFSRARLSL